MQNSSKPRHCAEKPAPKRRCRTAAPRSIALAACLIAAFGSEFAPAVDALEPVRGIVRAAEQAQISTELPSRVTQLTFKPGQQFRKGDLLVEFDCRRQQAELASADAQLREMRLTLDNHVYLEKLKAAGKQDVEVSRARADKAAAEADVLRLRLEQCKVIAPFDGRIVDLGISVHELPAPGRPFIRIIRDSQLEIELIIPSPWLRWLDVGAAFTFAIDETGETITGKVERIGGAVDPVSQTIKVVGVFEGVRKRVLAGMSGSAQFVRAARP